MCQVCTCYSATADIDLRTMYAVISISIFLLYSRTILVAVNLHTKGRYVCGLPMTVRTAGPIKTKLGIGTQC